MDHSHSGHIPSSGHAMTISAWLTGIYFIIEMGIGLWTGSIAVISDAFHTFSAVGGVLVAIAAARLAQRPADENRTFGWYRAVVARRGRRPRNRVHFAGADLEAMQA